MQPSDRLTRLRLPCGRARRRSTPSPAYPLDVPAGTGRRRAAAGVLAAVAWLAGLAAAQAEGPIVLRNVTGQTGIHFQHTDGSSGKHYIVEYVASGMATFDYDSDGLIDVYFLNGRPLSGTKADVPPRNHLYRNLGGWNFADVTEAAGVGDAGYGLGVAVGDCDNDGHPDLYVNNFGPNVLYRNQGDGTFADMTARAGVGRGDRVGAGDVFSTSRATASWTCTSPTTCSSATTCPCQGPPRAAACTPARANIPPSRTNSFATTETAPSPT